MVARTTVLGAQGGEPSAILWRNHCRQHFGKAWFIHQYVYVYVYCIYIYTHCTYIHDIINIYYYIYINTYLITAAAKKRPPKARSVWRTRLGAVFPLMFWWVYDPYLPMESVRPSVLFHLIQPAETWEMFGPTSNWQAAYSKKLVFVASHCPAGYILSPSDRWLMRALCERQFAAVQKSARPGMADIKLILRIPLEQCQQRVQNSSAKPFTPGKVPRTLFEHSTAFGHSRQTSQSKGQKAPFFHPRAADSALHCAVAGRCLKLQLQGLQGDF